MKMTDELTDLIFKKIIESGVPLTTQDVVNLIKNEKPNATRTKIVKRLTDLVFEGKINGRSSGGARGTKIWWKLEQEEET